METIISLLIILVPVIFKVIGTRLEKAAAEQKYRRTKPVAEAPVERWEDVVMRHLEQQLSQEEVLAEPEEEAVPEPVVTENPRPVVSERKPLRSAPILLEEEDVKRERIDPKKLVIYSEIMAPKYDE